MWFKPRETLMLLVGFIFRVEQWLVNAEEDRFHVSSAFQP
jgi:hypothetical protein